MNNEQEDQNVILQAQVIYDQAKDEGEEDGLFVVFATPEGASNPHGAHFPIQALSVAVVEEYAKLEGLEPIDVVHTLFKGVMTVLLLKQIGHKG